MDIHFVYLQDEIPSSEVGDGSWESGSAPHEPEEQGALIVGELLHDVPEPADERGARVNSLVRRYWLRVGSVGYLDFRKPNNGNATQDQFTIWKIHLEFNFELHDRQ